MSNRRKISPSATADSFARHYRCHDCRSITKLRPGPQPNVKIIEVLHDPTCPVLAGQVSPFAAAIQAAHATLTEQGEGA
jgi:hypothetical protein